MKSVCLLSLLSRPSAWLLRAVRPAAWSLPLAIFVLLASGVSAADPATKISFNVPAGDASVSLKAFADQSGLEIIYPDENVKGVATNAVVGQFTPREAIDLLLSGTVLTATAAKDGAIAVNRANGPNAERAAPVGTAGSRPDQEGMRDGRTVRMDPFQVETSKDTSYGALNSNSIARFDIELDKAPLSADVYTQAFMQDVDVTSIDSMLEEYGNAQMSFANPPGQVALNQPGDKNTTSGFTYRGISSGTIRMNGFVTESSNFSTTTNFDVERVEVIHGPQGLLYGPGGAGGTIVATTLQAKFDQNSGSLSERIDQYGSQRAVLQANAGNDWVAGTVALLNEDDRYRRLFLGDDSNGYYAQVAFRLPLNTTLRVDDSYTYQNIAQSSTETVSFGGVANDPRNGDPLAYLLYAGLAGPVNPATGQAFSKFGAIDNGHLSWQNLYSFGGDTQWELATNYNFDVIADTVWTSWLSTNIGFNYSRLDDLFGPGVGGNLSAPGENGNPYASDWAMNSTPSESMNNRRHKNFRASALLTNDFLGGKAKSQTSVGYDFQRQGLGGTSYGYYLSDSSGNLITTPGGTNLGRTAAPAQYWVVDNGPVLQPAAFAGQGKPIFYSAQNGQYYVKQLLNPASSAYVTPNNPLGLYSLATTPTGAALYPGVTGQDLPNYEKEVTSSGIYLANFTGWWNDLFTTMLGYRYTYTANHIPSGAAATVNAGPVDTSKFGSPSYNLGIDGRITPWLRWYYGYSANYNVANSETDFYGSPVDESYGKGQEVGLKFTPLDSRISGSFDYYVNNNTDYAVNAGNAILNDINPTNALNGPYNGPAGAGPYVAEDYVTHGLELAFNANPTPNWRIHLSANYSTGTVKSTASYGMLYNDQFYTDGKGNVTYANGTPFLVPVTPGTNVSGLSTTVNPATILASGPTQQLTTAMIGNPSSPYYAWQGTTVTSNGQIAPTSNVYKVLKNFNVPGAGNAYTGATGLPISAIQYAWPDPANTGGNWLVTEAGQDTVAYPVYSINLVNTYQIPSGPLKGLGAMLALSEQWQWRNEYYNTPTSNGIPLLWGQNTLNLLVNLHPFYERKFGRFLWRTQLDIDNLFNHYQLEITPNNGTGYTAATGVGIRWDNQPRAYSWSNTLTF